MASAAEFESTLEMYHFPSIRGETVSGGMVSFLPREGADNHSPGQGVRRGSGTLSGHTQESGKVGEKGTRPPFTPLQLKPYDVLTVALGVPPGILGIGYAPPARTRRFD